MIKNCKKYNDKKANPQNQHANQPGPHNDTDFSTNAVSLLESVTTGYQTLFNIIALTINKKTHYDNQWKQIIFLLPNYYLIRMWIRSEKCKYRNSPQKLKSITHQEG